MTASDICLSACPYILAGGVTRRVEDGAWVGIHQHYFDENTALPAFLAVSDIQRGQGEVMAYLIEMGIDPGLMQPALMTPPDEIYLLLPEELQPLPPRHPRAGDGRGLTAASLVQENSGGVDGSRRGQSPHPPLPHRAAPARRRPWAPAI